MQIPIADQVFTTPQDGSPPQLIGSRCASCDALDFPVAASCMRCGGVDASSVLLSSTGTLWTWTTQQFRPPSPPYARDDTAETFEPYAVGYIELPDGIRVESRLTGVDVDQLCIGTDMRMTLVPFGLRDGGDVLTFAFEPAVTS